MTVADIVRTRRGIPHYNRCGSLRCVCYQDGRATLEQAVYNYLTAPSKRTLKELWAALNDGSGGGE